MTPPALRLPNHLLDVRGRRRPEEAEYEYLPHRLPQTQLPDLLYSLLRSSHSDFPQAFGAD
jgi:hypothetical protein